MKAVAESVAHFYSAHLKSEIMEIWKDIKGYEGKYQVSSIGRVQSLDRIIIGKNGGKYFHNGKVLSPETDKDGYKRLSLCKKHKTVHRLVAEAFIDNPLNKKEVNHKNCIKSDNRIENLEWSTRKENLQHSYDNGLKRQGENSGASKLKEADIKYIRENYPKLSQQKLANMFNVTRPCIGYIIRNQTWTHI